MATSRASKVRELQEHLSNNFSDLLSQQRYLDFSSYLDLYVVTKDIFHITSEKDLANINQSKYNYYDCTFVFNFDRLKTIELKARSLTNCRFIVTNNSTETHDEDGRMRHSAAFILKNLVLESFTTKVAYTYRSTEKNYSNSLSILSKTGVVFDTNCFQATKENQGEPVVVEELALKIARDRFPCVSLTTPVDVRYSNKVYNFGKNAFICGVEFEIPVSYNGDLDERYWHKHTDGSQIKGDLEVSTRPLSLAYLSSQKFTNAVSKLWKTVNAPKNPAFYTEEDNEDGSGIHVHFSWQDDTIDALKLGKLMYKLVRSWGGEDWLLAVGGKSLSNLNCYSRFAEPGLGVKYCFVNVLNSKHLELRFAANSPSPEVALARVRALSMFFQVSLYIYKKLSIDSVLLLKYAMLKKTSKQ